jgi:hypothetical protein
MHKLILASLMAVLLASNTGCCIVDRLFQCKPCCGWLSGQGMCGTGCCNSCGYDPHSGGCGGCGECEGGGCDACDSCGGGDCNSWDCAQGYSDGCYTTYGAHTPGGCRSCGFGGGPSADDQLYNEPGPPTGAITYPYYTTRGPRDFLARNPASIGP